MKVLLATAYPTPWSHLPQFRRLAAANRFGGHQLTEEAGNANIILFVDARHEHNDWRFRAIRAHPLTRKYPGKAFVYNEVDQPWCSMQGLYVSMPRQSFHPGRQSACGYIGELNSYIGHNSETEPDLLFSFSGRRCHPARDEVLALSHPRALIEDTSGYNFFGDANRPPHEMEAARRRYADMLARSKFVLCPRGSGTASFRLFEAMKAGRVPVIISDDWVAPPGPDWPAFSLRIPESDVGTIPGVLERREGDFAPMSQAARLAWEEWFAEDVLFHRMVEACAALMAGRWLPEPLAARIPSLRYVRLLMRDVKRAALSAARPSS